MRNTYSETPWYRPVSKNFKTHKQRDFQQALFKRKVSSNIYKK